MSDLREALERTLDVYAAISEPEVADAEAEVRNAARRFLALTETGPDYEYVGQLENLAALMGTNETIRETTGTIVADSISAALLGYADFRRELADYLTEEGP